MTQKITRITITPTNDNINGTSNADIFDALAGNDTVFGLGGNDTLIGNTGDDSLIGGIGNDNLQGSEGNDTLIGGTGVDMLNGGTGNDLYFVDNVRDKVVEDNTSDGGVGTVKSNVSYSLSDKKGVENLTLTGKQNLKSVRRFRASRVGWETLFCPPFANGTVGKTACPLYSTTA